MARPKFCRRISQKPVWRIFKPVGAPVKALEEIVLSMDEFEAIRLADLEGLYQEQAAERMNVSRQTFGRIVEVARRKVARVLSEGLALRIEGGEVEIPEKRAFKCNRCQHTWGEPFGTSEPEQCPECESRAFCSFEDHYGSMRSGEACRAKHSRKHRSGPSTWDVEEDWKE
ncbi:MAG: DUF134 domain-containing protein [Desulfomonile tiedjei]|uniref:UPF0251 protein HY912_09175 n=1 Tax=Desulfomonile tiedjei TaxID=2358 RepID=A0A9D6V0H4_9BACT|nr:DUF134 domain-containing protein [Desulfomonile tiedjei]